MADPRTQTKQSLSDRVSQLEMNTLMTEIGRDINDYVKDWSEGVRRAIDTAVFKTPDAPLNPKSAAIAAAAGNMIWAATCLLPGPWKLASVVMSFGGAGAASAAGILAVTPDGDIGQNVTTNLIASMKAQVDEAEKRMLSDGSRAKLKPYFYKIMQDAGLAGQFGINQHEIGKRVWEHLFRIPFGNGEGDAKKALQDQTKCALEDFYKFIGEQYAKFSKKIADEAQESYDWTGIPSVDQHYGKVRLQYIKEHNTLTEFNKWLRTDPGAAQAMKKFLSQRGLASWLHLQ